MRSHIGPAAWLLAALLLIFACARAGKENPTPAVAPRSASSVAALAEPFPAPEPGALGETRLAGDSIATIDDGDFAYPRFSPDGGKLAYAKVISENDFENTEILVLDLTRRIRTTLLDAETAKGYATYKAFVYALGWPDTDHVRASLSDGDVDSSHLTFDTRTGTLTGSTHSGEDEEMLPSLPPEQQRALQRTRAILRDLPGPVLDGAFLNNPVLVEERAVILQKRYEGYEDDVFLVDFKNTASTTLVRLADGSGWSLQGGVPFGDATLILLSSPSKASLILHAGGRVKVLAELAKTRSGPSLEVKWRSPRKAIFEVKVSEPYERGDNPLFVFDGQLLTRVTDYPELYDVDIDPSGRKAAFCYWEGDDRHIAIRALQD